MSKILAIGAHPESKNSLVGRVFKVLYPRQIDLMTPRHSELDVTQRDQIRLYMRLNKPKAVINFAAFSDINQAEFNGTSPESLTVRLNTYVPDDLAYHCWAHDALLYHISTGFVFSGQEIMPGPYDETVDPRPHRSWLTRYGQTKLDGEIAIANRTVIPYAIVRIDYPIVPQSLLSIEQKPGYISKILKLFEEGKPFFEDQYITVTPVTVLTEVLYQAMHQGITGILHVASTNSCTPYEIARYVISRVCGQQIAAKVKSSSLKQWIAEHPANPYRYPQYGGLKCERTQSKFPGVRFLSWQETVDQALAT